MEKDRMIFFKANLEHSFLQSALKKIFPLFFVE